MQPSIKPVLPTLPPLEVDADAQSPVPQSYRVDIVAAAPVAETHRRPH